MRIQFRLQNNVIDAERIVAVNKELAYLAARGWTVESIRWVTTNVLEIQMRAQGDEERLNGFLQAMLRLGPPGWSLYGNLPAEAGLAL